MKIGDMIKMKNLHQLGPSDAWGTILEVGELMPSPGLDRIAHRLTIMWRGGNIGKMRSDILELVA